MKIKSNIPYAVVSEGVLTFFKEGVPLWAIMLIVRIHHFNSRRCEKYTLYLEKESIKLRIRPDDIINLIEQNQSDGFFLIEKVNAGLFLISLSDELRKELDLLA
jgi:hypothetical protein